MPLWKGRTCGNDSCMIRRLVAPQLAPHSFDLTMSLDWTHMQTAVVSSVRHLIFVLPSRPLYLMADHAVVDQKTRGLRKALNFR